MYLLSKEFICESLKALIEGKFPYVSEAKSPERFEMLVVKDRLHEQESANKMLQHKLAEQDALIKEQSNISRL